VIVPLAEWYPAMHRRWLNDGRRLRSPAHSRTGFTVHHTAGGDQSDPLWYAQSVARAHFDKWSRPGGYNFQIGTDGTVFEMCGWEHVGAHAPGCNFGTIGVSFQGTFVRRLPNDAQLAAFARLVGEGPVTPAQKGHRDCSSTTCPGVRLWNALPLPVTEPEDDMTPEQDKMLREVHAALDAGAKTNAVVRIRRSLRPIGRALGLKADVNGGDDDVIA
jgi:hypothetical protein